jgi:parallel beta-helix repeat protein
MNVPAEKPKQLKKIMKILGLILSLTYALSFAQTGKRITLKSGDNVQKEFQTALIKINDGDTIVLSSGVYKFKSGISLEGKNNIYIVGEGQDKTILSFTGQASGAEGFIVKNGKNIVLKDFAVEETKGDAIKVQEVDGISFLGIRVEWPGDPDSSNGAYGLYPVTCRNVLIDRCIARGASDAGIYVGQSQNIIVKNCLAEKNVAGIEIENSIHADVFDNVSTNNSGGILVFDMPGLTIKNGGKVRVFNNKCIKNNHPNFAPAGNIVGIVPAGTGMIIMACSDIEIFDNVIEDNATMSVGIASFDITQKPVTDPEYNRYPSAIYIYNNKIKQNKNLKADESRFLGQAVAMLRKEQGMYPDIIYDGLINTSLLVNEKIPPDKRICLQNNGNILFLNLKELSVDITEHNCQLKKLEKVNLTK